MLRCSRSPKLNPNSPRNRSGSQWGVNPPYGLKRRMQIVRSSLDNGPLSRRSLRRLCADTVEKEKIEQLRNSREGRILGASVAAGLHRTDARVCGRFRVNRCGPSRRRGSGAPAVPKNFVRQPKETFSEADIIKSGNRPRNDAPTTPICFEAGVATPIGTVSGTDDHIVRK